LGALAEELSDRNGGCVPAMARSWSVDMGSTASPGSAAVWGVSKRFSRYSLAPWVFCPRLSARPELSGRFRTAGARLDAVDRGEGCARFSGCLR